MFQPPQSAPGGAPPPSPQPQQAPAPSPAGGGGDMMARIQALQPQEAQTFIEGINRGAIEVLKKVVPELAPILDSIITKYGGDDGQPGGDLGPEQGGPGGGEYYEPPQPAAPAQRPSRLSQY